MDFNFKLSCFRFSMFNRIKIWKKINLNVQTRKMVFQVNRKLLSARFINSFHCWQLGFGHRSVDSFEPPCNSGCPGSHITVQGICIKGKCKTRAMIGSIVNHQEQVSTGINGFRVKVVFGRQ